MPVNMTKQWGKLQNQESKQLSSGRCGWCACFLFYALFYSVPEVDGLVGKGWVNVKTGPKLSGS
jgi:hypothetical protein